MSFRVERRIACYRYKETLRYGNILTAGYNVATPVVFGANGLVEYGGYIYHFDPQGNAVHLMDNSRNVLANLAYDAWGQLISGSNPTPYGYKAQWGYYTDAESGILLLTHRTLTP